MLTFHSKFSGLEWEHAIGLFGNYLKTEKRYSVHTSGAYTQDLQEAVSFFLKEFEVKSLQEITSGMVRSWVMHLSDAGREPKTVHRKISSLRSFYKFLVKKGHLPSIPFSEIPLPKIRKKLPQFVESDKMELLLDHVTFGDSFEGVRDKTIINLFYGSGMRLSELVNLNVQDIDFSRKSVKVLGKRNKERIIPLPAEVLTDLVNYLVLRNSEFAGEAALFLTGKGKRVYPRMVYGCVKAYLSAVTTAGKRSPHVLRHTYATHLLNNGADINAIKELLGHANLAATQVYTHNTPEKLKKIHAKTHPRG